jgi:hypothetical protein
VTRAGVPDLAEPFTYRDEDDWDDIDTFTGEPRRKRRRVRAPGPTHPSPTTVEELYPACPMCGGHHDRGPSGRGVDPAYCRPLRESP